MLRVHTEAPLRLTHAGLRVWQRGHGAVINVASISGFHGQHAWGDVRGHQSPSSSAERSSGRRGCGQRVKVQALCPGFTHTEFHEARPHINMDVDHIPAFMWMDARRVAVVASLKPWTGGGLG